MAKLNRSLVMSIINDVREVNRVTEEIRSCCLKDSIEHHSWKFPTKLAKNVHFMEIVEKHDGTAGELYILLLELAYDSRIHFVLRLILDFIDECPPLIEEKEEISEESTNVKRPNYVSLACIVHLLWNRLKIIAEYLSKRDSDQKKNRTEVIVDWHEKKEFISKGVQASCELNHCECCSIASEIILRMINAIKSAFHENKLISAVAKERDLLKEDIYEKTQWAVMRRLAAAIEMDIKTTFEMMQVNHIKRETIKRNYEVEKKLNYLQTELSRKETDLDLLRAEHFQLEERIQNITRDFDLLKEKNIQMEEEMRKKLIDELENNRMKMARTEESWDILQSQTLSLAENKLELENSVRRLVEEKKKEKKNKMVVGNRDACLETERAFRILLTELERENHSIKMEYRVKVEELERKLEEMKNREIAKIYDTERNDGELYEETILMPEDDPELDMTRQLISNRQKIELLQRQNERLSKTLNRLKEYRLTTITTNNTTTTNTTTMTMMKMKTTNAKSLFK